MLTPLLVALLAPPRTIYVSPTGSDSHDGLRAARPLRTISEAARRLMPGDTCVVLAGTYRETVVPARSGTATAPITFRAAPGAKVVVDGTEPVTGWRAVGGGIFEARYEPFRSRMNQDDQLFVDGAASSRARWPNLGPDPSRPRQATLDRFVSKTRDKARNLTTVVFEDDELGALHAEQVVGASIYVQPNHHGWSWTLSGKVVALEGTRLTMETRSDNGKDFEPHRYEIGSRYFVWGKESLMDAPGEWVVDRERGTVRLRLAPGMDPAKLRIAMKRRDFAFDLSERSHIRLVGLGLVGASVTTDAMSGGDAIPYDEAGAERYPWRPKNHLVGSEGVHLVDLDVHYPNSITDVSGHFFFQWGSNTGLVLSGSDHRVERCRVRFADGNGITLTGRRHRALGNTVLDANLIATDCGAIYTAPNGPAEDIEIAYNTIERTGRSAIGLRYFQNSDPTKPRARVHHNRVRNFMLQDWDGGAFYAIGHDGKFARIDHNVFEIDAFRAESMVFGIYFDFAKNYIADHNLVLGTVTPIQVTREFDPDGAKVNNLVIVNNTAITNDAMWGRPLSANIGRGSVYLNNVLKVAVFRNPNGAGNVNHWPVYGSGLKEGIAIARHNLVYGDDPNGVWGKAESFNPLDHYDPKDPGLLPDYRPKPGSVAATGGAVLEPIVREGVTVAPVVRFAGRPYIGAFAPDQPRWRAGAEAYPGNAKR